jgi:hypothetical protein
VIIISDIACHNFNSFSDHPQAEFSSPRFKCLISSYTTTYDNTIYYSKKNVGTITTQRYYQKNIDNNTNSYHFEMKIKNKREW